MEARPTPPSLVESEDEESQSDEENHRIGKPVLREGSIAFSHCGQQECKNKLFNQLRNGSHLFFKTNWELSRLAHNQILKYLGGVMTPVSLTQHDYYPSYFPIIRITCGHVEPSNVSKQTISTRYYLTPSSVRLIPGRKSTKTKTSVFARFCYSDTEFYINLGNTERRRFLSSQQTEPMNET